MTKKKRHAAKTDRAECTYRIVRHVQKICDPLTSYETVRCSKMRYSKRHSDSCYKLNFSSLNMSPPDSMNETCMGKDFWRQ